MSGLHSRQPVSEREFQPEIKPAYNRHTHYYRSILYPNCIIFWKVYLIFNKRKTFSYMRYNYLYKLFSFSWIWIIVNYHNLYNILATNLRLIGRRNQLDGKVKFIETSTNISNWKQLCWQQRCWSGLFKVNFSDTFCHNYLYVRIKKCQFTFLAKYSLFIISMLYNLMSINLLPK